MMLFKKAKHCLIKKNKDMSNVLSTIAELPKLIYIALWFPIVILIFWIIPDKKRKSIVEDLCKILESVFRNKPPNLN
jgi:hypothetical protein